MKTKQIVIVDVDHGRVAYDLYEVRDVERLSHGEVIDDEPAEVVIDRLVAYFGPHAIVARHRPSPSVSAPTVTFAGIEHRGE